MTDRRGGYQGSAGKVPQRPEEPAAGFNPPAPGQTAGGSYASMADQKLVAEIIREHSVALAWDAAFEVLDALEKRGWRPAVLEGAGPECSCPYPNPKPKDVHRGCSIHGEPAPGPGAATHAEAVATLYEASYGELRDAFEQLPAEERARWARVLRGDFKSVPDAGAGS